MTRKSSTSRAQGGRNWYKQVKQSVSTLWFTAGNSVLMLKDREGKWCQTTLPPVTEGVSVLAVLREALPKEQIIFPS